jgi:hypothetical protein
VFGYSTLDTLKQNEYKLAEKKINQTFGEVNEVALILPYKDYESEEKLYDDLCQLEGVDEVIALAGTEAEDGYMVTSALTPRQFSDLTDLDIAVSRTLYMAYCTQNDNLAAENFRLRQNGLEIFTHRRVALRSFEKPDIYRKHSVKSRAKNAHSVRGTPGLPEFFVGFMFKSTKRRLKAVAAALLQQRDLGNFPAVAGSYLHKTISFFRLRFILPQKRLFGNDFQSF